MKGGGCNPPVARFDSEAALHGPIAQRIEPPVSTGQMGVRFSLGPPDSHVGYQAEDWSCGPASIVNACRVLGLRVSERSVRSLCGTTPDGTDDVQMIAAVRSLGLTATPHHSSDVAAAWAFVRSNAMEGRPSLICIDQWRHWVSIIGTIGGLVIIADPIDTKTNRAENGIHTMSRTALVRRWRCRNEDEPFYAIAIGK